MEPAGSSKYCFGGAVLGGGGGGGGRMDGPAGIVRRGGWRDLVCSMLLLSLSTIGFCCCCNGAEEEVVPVAVLCRIQRMTDSLKNLLSSHILITLLTL